MGEVDALLGALKVGVKHIFQVVASTLCAPTPEVDRVQESVGGPRLCALHCILINNTKIIYTAYITFCSCRERTSIIPIPKTTAADNPNDYRPVALLPVVMKCFVRLVCHEDQLRFCFCKGYSMPLV